MRSSRAFTFVEVLIAMVIMAILGGVAISALFFLVTSFSQAEDYAAGRQDIEYVFQKLGRELTNAGLGMPNNRSGAGTFAESFRGTDDAHSPIMAFMGERGAGWGGPITLGIVNSNDRYGDRNMYVQISDDVLSTSDNDVYLGSELYYAWSIPTGARIELKTDLSPTSGDQDLDSASEAGLAYSNGGPLSFDVIPAGLLATSKYEGRDISPRVGSPVDPRDPRSWILFSTFRVPMLLEERSVTSDVETITVRVAPESSLIMGGMMTGLEEVHLPMAARVYLRDHQLIQVIFGENIHNSAQAVAAKHVLINNVAAVYFKFEAGRRLLTMYVATFGRDIQDVSEGGVARWPAFAPPIPTELRRRRFVVESLTWRIRN